MKGLIQKLQVFADALPSGAHKEEVLKDILLLKTVNTLEIYEVIKNKYYV